VSPKLKDEKKVHPQEVVILLIEVRSGAWTLEKFLGEAEALRLEAEGSAVSSSLPDEVSKEAISDLIAKAHLSFWNER